MLVEDHRLIGVQGRSVVDRARSEEKLRRRLLEAVGRRGLRSLFQPLPEPTPRVPRGVRILKPCGPTLKPSQEVREPPGLHHAAFQASQRFDISGVRLKGFLQLADVVVHDGASLANAAASRRWPPSRQYRTQLGSGEPADRNPRLGAKQRSGGPFVGEASDRRRTTSGGLLPMLTLTSVID